MTGAAGVLSKRNISTTSSIIKKRIDEGICRADIENGILYKKDGKPYKINIDKDGYERVYFGYKNKASTIKASVHRVIAYAKYGDIALWESNEVDHINRNKRDNRGLNLRIISKKINRGREAWFGKINYVITDDKGMVYAGFRNKEDAIEYCEKNKKLIYWEI